MLTPSEAEKIFQQCQESLTKAMVQSKEVSTIICMMKETMKVIHQKVKELRTDDPDKKDELERIMIGMRKWRNLTAKWCNYDPS